MTSEASIRLVFRHALLLAVMKDDLEEAGSQLVSSVGGDRALLEEAHGHYRDVVREHPTDDDSRRALVLLEWALAGGNGTREAIGTG